MDVSSWFRRKLLRNTKNDNTPDGKTSKLSEQPRASDSQNDALIFGITDSLIDHVKSFTVETFKSFSLSDGQEGKSGDDSPSTSGNVRNDLSEWQERHAVLVLTKVKELSQLRYKLCPVHLKEHQFWRVYFSLVKTQIAEYELQAIRVAKIKAIKVQNGESADNSACEVEMSETKNSANLPPPTP